MNKSKRQIHYCIKDTIAIDLVKPNIVALLTSFEHLLGYPLILLDKETILIMLPFICCSNH